MLRKRLSLFLAVVMVLSMVFSSVFASPVDRSYMPETRREAIEGSHKAYEVDSFEKPDMANPFGAVPTKEDDVGKPATAKPFSQELFKIYEEDTDEEIIRDREGDLTPEDMVGVREIEENPYGAVKSKQKIEVLDEESLESSHVMGLAMTEAGLLKSENFGDRAYKHVKHLSVSIGPRRAGTENEYKARDYIKSVFESLGYSVELQGFGAITQSAVQEAAATVEDIIEHENTEKKEELTEEVMEEEQQGEMDEEEEMSADEEAEEAALKDEEGEEVQEEVSDDEKIEELEEAESTDEDVEESKEAEETVVEESDKAEEEESVDERADEIEEENGVENIIENEKRASKAVLEKETSESYRYYNVIATKPGLSDKVVIVGAHYDSVTAGLGADDNASGVGIMLEAAEILAYMDTPYTIKFIAFAAEEIGLRGSNHYVQNMTSEDIANTVAMINIDTCIAGDFAYVYGGSTADDEKGWVRNKALALARNLGLDLRTNPGLNPAYPVGTTGDWSDHAPFRKAGIPYAYFEATNWEIGDKDGYDQTVKHGAIMHTNKDTLNFIEREFPGRVQERLHTFVTVLTNLLLYIDEPLYQGMRLSGNLASMTEERIFDVAVDFGYIPDLDDIEWTFGGIPFEEWKKIDYTSGSLTDDSFIKFETEPYLEGTTVKARIKFELPFGRYVNGSWEAVDTLDRRPYPRTYYPRLLGTYDLTATDEDRDVSVSAPIKLNAYDSYHTWDEIKPAIDKIINKTLPNRYIEYKSLGKSVEGRDTHFVILAESKAAVDKYLNEILPMALENPAELQRKIDNKELLDYKIPIWFNNIHPDEAPGTDAILGLLELLATKNHVEYEDIDINENKQEKPQTKTTVRLSVPELLDNFIFLFNFTVNPDGRYYNTRTNVNGFDINRDCSFQTQPEAINTIKGIVEWKPLTFLDFHGHVKKFLIEPTTPPHDPNYEYDLLVRNMLRQAYAMGRAGIGSTRYSSFIIPREDYESGWDDGSPVYTPMYAMHHGALGHTIEIPDINEHSYNALIACGLAAAKFALDNKDELYINQLEIFRRGIENIDAKELVDKEFVDGHGNVVGRPRGEYDNFFPEYYVIPVDPSLQRNVLEAHLMVEYLLRNGILVDRTTVDVAVGDKVYPKGTYVVDMHQAIRGYANAVLSDGYDISTFDDMYAETVMNFHDVWGFDRDAIREKDVFKGKVERITEVHIPRTETPNASDYYIIKNNTNDAIRGINELLKKGEKVSMTLSSGNGYEAGDFVVTHKGLYMIKDKYYLEVLPFDGGSLTKEIPKPQIALVGSGNIEFVLKQLGFDYTTKLEDGNIILATTATNVKSYIEAGIPYVGIGPNPISFVGTNGILAVSRETSYYEGLFKSKIAKDSLINSNYKEEEWILNPYGSGTYFTAVPDNVKVLARVTTDEDFFKAGWWLNNEEVKGAALAVQGEYNNTPITLFAFNLANKGQPKHYFRMLANAIYTSLMNIEEATHVMELSNNKASMTEKRVIEVRFNLGEEVTAEDLEWTYGGKPLSEWKKYRNGSYSGNPFINVIEVKVKSDNTVRAKIEFDMPYDTADLSGSARRLYPNLIGTYDLVAKNKNTGSMAKGAIKLNAYDSYHTWDEIKPAIDEIFLKAKDNRYLEYVVLGKSTEGRDMHHVILAKNRKAIDTYLNYTLPLMKENPKKLQEMIENGTIGDYKVPIFFNNIHPDEAPGVDVILKLLEKLATEDVLTYKDFESIKEPMTPNKDGRNIEDSSTERIININVDEALDNIIFLFNFTENPDGRYYNTRQNVNGFDVNRDNGYQTQVESKLVTAQIAKWSPISMIDYHGFVKGFLIEPCTTPHEPNYEYDLLIENMLEQAHLMGRAGVANTKYTSYVIPYEDYSGGWDDGTPAYTPTYAMFHGALASTVEMPELNEESLNATYYVGLACINYVMTNKDRLFHNQLEIFRRGVENIDDRRVDEYLLNAAGEVIGRPRGEYENFFPDYYVIPVEKPLQRNALEAYNIAEYLLRNDVKVEVLEEAVTVGDITYPAGSFIVPMNQAKRSYANCVLYDGFDVSDFREMYAEIVMNFHDTRGFDRYIVRGKGIFEGKTRPIYQATIPERPQLPDAAYYIIENSNNDVVRLVNELLKENRSVGMILEDGENYNKGDFIIKKEDLAATEGYIINIVPSDVKPEVKDLTLPKVEAIGGSQTQLGFALRELGFELVTDDSNVIVGTSGNSSVRAAIEGGKSYIGIGASALNFARSNNLITGLNYRSTGYEGLLNCEVNSESLITAGYRTEETLYNPQGAYITNAGDATVLTKVVDRDDYFKAGWWTNNSEVRGQVLAVTKKVGEAHVTLFANNIVNKAHPQKEWRMLANAIFMSVPSKTPGSFDIILEDAPESFKLGGDANVTVSITNNTDREQRALLIVALYDVDAKTMVSYAAGSESVAVGGHKRLSASLSIPKTGNYVVKAFVWDSWETQQPLSKALVVPVE